MSSGSPWGGGGGAGRRRRLQRLESASSAGRAAAPGPPGGAEPSRPGQGAPESTAGQGHHSLADGQRLALKYVAADVRRQGRSFAVGVFTVFLVVFFCALLLNSVLKSPVIFFKLAENEVGELDVVLAPGVQIEGRSVPAEQGVGTGGGGGGLALPAAAAAVNGSGGLAVTLVNHTLLNTTTADFRLVYGTAPRWALVGSVSDASAPEDEADDSPAASAVLLGLDMRQEDAVGLGREWTLPPLDGPHAYASRSVVRQAGLDPADAVGASLRVRIDPARLAEAAGLLEADDDGDDSAANEALAEALVRALVPGADEAWDDEVELDVRDALLNGTAGTNLTALLGGGGGGGAINASEALDAIERQVLGPLGLNLTFPAAVRNATSAADLEREARGFLESLDANQTTARTTVGDLFSLAASGSLGQGLGLGAALGNLSIEAVVEVRGVVGSPQGKWPTALGSVVAVDADYVWGLLVESLADAVEALAGALNPLLRGSGTAVEVPVGGGGGDGGGGTVAVDLGGAANGTLAALRAAAPGGINATALREALEDLRKEDFAMLSVVQYRERLAAYFSALEPMWRHMARLTDGVAERIGHDYPAWFETPVATSLEQTIWVRYFLDNIFGSVTALIAMLGVILVYSLMLNDVESRTYEYGMLRALGMRKRTLVQILVTKSAGFAALGIALGLALCVACNVPIARKVAEFAALPPDYRLYAASAALGVALGLVMPMVANVLPVRRALSRTLRDSLDVYHHVVSEHTVRMVRLERMGLSAWQTAAALLLITVGFVTFYLVPYAFTFQNFPLFLALLNAILLGMLLGLCILSVWVQPHGERLLLRLLLWGSHRRLAGVVRKNLSGHRPRNRKTALMFVISVAFVVFAGVMFQLQSRTIADNIRVFFGADLVAFAPSTSEALREAEMTAFLDREVARRERGEPGGVVVDYTFVTFQLRDFDEVSHTELNNLAQFPGGAQWVYGVQQNYLNVAYASYYSATETRRSPGGAAYPQVRGGGGDDCVAMLFADAGGALLPDEEAAGGPVVPRGAGSGVRTGIYAPPEDGGGGAAANMTESYRGYVDLVMSESMREHASVSLSVPLDLRVQRYNPATGLRVSRYYLAKARGMVKKLPGFFFSSYRVTATWSSVVVAEPQFLRMLRDAREFAGVPPPDSAPKQKVMVRVTGGATRAEREDVLNGLRALFVSDASFGVDTRDVVASTGVAIEMLNLFFTVVGAIAMILCFFILWMSFTSNVLANGWEFGVLRSLGLSGTQCVLVYVYEALAVVLTSLAVGTAIGIVIAVTLQVQFNLFVELPFEFAFPHTVFWSMAGMSVCVAVAGSYLPARAFMRRAISDVLRRT